MGAQRLDRQKVEPPVADGGPPPSNYGLTRLTDEEELNDLGRLVLKASSGSPQSDGGESLSG
jgi:hypothetical protein